jgi:EmrB/QacA subfamily drug resistance transporter
MPTSLPGPTDPAAAAAAPSGAARHPRLVLTTTILASSLAFIDGSVVNVALPAIGRSYGASAAELQWAVNAYLLPLSALLLLGGAAGDLYGRRRLLIIGTTLFAAASLACALAPSLELLLAARAVQGVGAALLMPSSLAILGSAFSGERRGRAIGTWAAAGAIAGALGPLIGGWLVDTVGWPPIFLVNLPVALAAILLAFRYVEETDVEPGSRLDWGGGLLATAGLGALTWGLTSWSSQSMLWPGAGAATAAGVVLLSLFLLAERRQGDRAMMPLALFASSSFVGVTMLTLLLYGALGGLLVLLPFVLIEAAGYSALAAGAALLPFPLVIALGSRLMGRLAERIGPRVPLTVGPLIAAAGYLLLTRVEGDSAYWDSVLPAILLLSLGMAGAVAPLTAAVLTSVDRRHTGTASGFNSAVARTGGLIATALIGGVISSAGSALLPAFHAAALVGAGAAAAAGGCAYLLLGNVVRPQRLG